MSGSIGLSVYKLGFQISPIILSGGIASAITGGYLPLLAITEAANFVTGLLSGGTDLSLDSFFCQFRPMAGGTLVDQQFGTYPFANIAVAANATIAQPLRISLQMVCPVNSPGGYFTKLATITALKATLDAHNAGGGSYIVATPSYIYNNCLLRSFRDISPLAGAQAQTHWQWDFEQPLLTQADAFAAQNTLMSRLTNGLVSDGSLSGAGQTAGNPLSGVSGQLPGAQNLFGTTPMASPAAT